jgi:hypothetical protein
LHTEFVAAVRAAIGACLDITSDWSWLCHLSSSVGRGGMPIRTRQETALPRLGRGAMAAYRSSVDPLPQARGARSTALTPRSEGRLVVYAAVCSLAPTKYDSEADERSAHNNRSEKRQPSVGKTRLLSFDQVAVIPRQPRRLLPSSRTDRWPGSGHMQAHPAIGRAQLRQRRVLRPNQMLISSESPSPFAT